uniref:Uncharacterized protein n=1 Tax=Picea glauca TaxID=3330 RepID=A0A101M5M3_PICGL|nr:hypothetical protein ABT39_MTgene1278 [Picea glauca]QHR88257.1 hypothetical protein Q903MT_gene2270 [Picea sitchensis]
MVCHSSHILGKYIGGNTDLIDLLLSWSSRNKEAGGTEDKGAGVGVLPKSLTIFMANLMEEV